MKKFVAYVGTDKNGTKIYHDYTCTRCGGLGGADAWAYTGWTCYKCGGTGRADKPQIIKEYTPEYRAKLDAINAKRAETKRLKRVEEIKAKLPEMLEERGFSKAGNLYVVIGDTYSIKDELREAGAHWKQALQSWVFTEPVTQYPTVEIKWDEVMTVDYESGYLNWKAEAQDIVTAKIPKEEQVISEYIGSIGDRLNVEATLRGIFTFEKPAYRGYGTDTIHIYKFTDDAGNILIWNTTAFAEVHEGDRVNLVGTISEHKEYAGDKQTVLKRCKVQRVA